MAKILIIEDDLALADMIKQWLSMERYQIEICPDGLEAMSLLKAYTYDLLILDLALPSLDGIDLLRSFRTRGGTTPVLILTGKEHINEKVEGFNSGADDYLTKPFHMKELSLRANALMRRSEKFLGNILTAGDLTLEPETYRATKKGRTIHLKRKEFALLEFFMRHPNQVFSPVALIERIWPTESDASPETVRSHIARLRRKIESDVSPKISTLYGLGYKFEVH